MRLPTNNGTQQTIPFHLLVKIHQEIKKIIVRCTVRVALWHRDPLDQRICFHVIDIANILNTQKDWGNLS